MYMPELTRSSSHKKKKQESKKTKQNDNNNKQIQTTDKYIYLSNLASIKKNTRIKANSNITTIIYLLHDRNSCFTALKLFPSQIKYIFGQKKNQIYIIYHCDGKFKKIEKQIYLISKHNDSFQSLEAKELVASYGKILIAEVRCLRTSDSSFSNAWETFFYFFNHANARRAEIFSLIIYGLF